MKKRYVVLLGVVVCTVTFGIYTVKRARRVPAPVQQPEQTGGEVRPHSFAECVAQGYAVQETQPRRCQAGKIAFVDTESTPNQDGLAAPVQLDNVTPHALVKSPLTVRGTAPGNWFFEANIGLRILDEQGVEVARGHAEADGDWMTNRPVRFVGTVNFTVPASEVGYIEIQKDNPSDKPGLDASVRIPVRFK